MTTKLSKLFIDKAKAVTAKRPKTVIDHILKHGKITTDELKTLYGYDHPPRAARDVRENGIGLKTEYLSSPDGRRMASYVFDETGGNRYSKRSGRTAFSSKLKQELLDLHGACCFIYREVMPVRDLQIDHRIPFEIAGDKGEQSQNAADFMLLCGSANRAKSWSCEHCPNWTGAKDPKTCARCY